MTHGLPQRLTPLLSQRAYPHPVDAVQLVQTHISWILLTGEFAYKIKRPVCYAFIDLRSAERRAFYCAEEIRLNRRFAPELYLKVCDIAIADGEVRIGGPGEVIERAVMMRQFRREEELDTLLAAGRIEPAELETFGRGLADMHARLPVATQAQPWGGPAAIRRIVLDNLEQCIDAAAMFNVGRDVQALRESLEGRLAAGAPWMLVRLASARVRECHGDLHSRNIVRYESRLIPFDCMEFEPAFRWIDVADEIGFLLADLDVQNCPLHAGAFLNGYLAKSGDYQACRLLSLYKAHRSLIRAKVSAVSAADAEPSALEAARALCVSYIECARVALAPKHPMLILMSGLSGSGKTWLASRLAPPLGAVHLRSDVERKRLAGLAELAHSGSAIEQGLYSREASAHLYEQLAHHAEDVVAGGWTVIVDATFGRRADRARFRELASRLGVELRLIQCRASPEALRARIASRQRAGTDASEADMAVLQWQKGNFETYSLDEGLVVIDVASDNDVVPPLASVLARLR